MTTEIYFNDDRDTRFSIKSNGFERVLFVCHTHWHGIRSAMAALPGHKLCIPHGGSALDGAASRHVLGLLVHYDIRTVCFHGFSPVASWLASDLKKHFGTDIQLSVVTHVNSAQFENHFEMEMQARISRLQSLGVVTRHGSVKPNFDSVNPGCWGRTLINCAPALKNTQSPSVFDPSSVFIPVENTWRKNLYTNVLAANCASEVKRINTVNWPTGLEEMVDLSKLRLIGYKRGAELYATMAAASVILGVTLAECQPMTELEGLAVGTPSLSGPLMLEEFASDQLTKLTRVPAMDNPRIIADTLDALMTLRRTRPDEVAEMVSEHLSMRSKLCVESYADFLGI